MGTGGTHLWFTHAPKKDKAPGLLGFSIFKQGCLLAVPRHAQYFVGHYSNSDVMP